MGDQEARRLEGVSWRRDPLSSDVRSTGRRHHEPLGSSGGSALTSWNSFGARGGGGGGPPPLARSGDGMSSNQGAASSNGLRSSLSYGGAEAVGGTGLGSIRGAPSQKNTGWTAIQTPVHQGAYKGPDQQLQPSHQQRKGHSEAPSVCCAEIKGTTFSSTSRHPPAATVEMAAAEASIYCSGGDTDGGDAASRSTPEGVSSSSAAAGGVQQVSPRSQQESPMPPSPQGTFSLPGGSAAAAAAGVSLGCGLTWRPRRALTREEEIERNVKSLLNKLTIEKFNVISEKVALTLEEALARPSEVQLIVNAVIDKAVTEPDWSEMYADLCQVLQWRSVSPEGDSETIRKTPFMLALLNRIQTEFESMPTVLTTPPAAADSEDDQLELSRLKRRVLGVVKLIGELFHRRLLGFKVVNDVVVQLVMRSDAPDEHLVECFLQLIATVGYFIDQNPKMKVVLDSWWWSLLTDSASHVSSSGGFVSPQDTFDMRRAEWRKKVHKERAKALNDLRDQLETEEVLGGSIHAAQYGNIVVVGERTNLNGHYLGYLKEQEAIYEGRVAQRCAAAGVSSRRPVAPS
ncbi:eukaryotic translation initiation [Cyclospora cayetanensis]|uniref:Eukaryotic translation initiation n=1 Tax=Cyclospora cayetanensis TaxID=88456 RepID=A0A1D3CU77_9EIME|nr:eukaryotic translation initiation [Cyclospora cayetanensis]